MTPEEGGSPAAGAPIGERSPRIRRWTRIGLRAALLAMVIVAIFFALAKRFILGGGDVLGADSVAVEFVNKTDHPIRMVSVRCSGGTLETRELKPGESLKGRVWPKEAVRLGEAYDSVFVVRFVGQDGAEKRYKTTISFSPMHYVPMARWVLNDSLRWKEELFSPAITDRPSPEYLRSLRRKLGL